ncbi:Putative NAD(P)H-dependent FMN-containing oxidoreductase ywqN [uncultured Clostridium sp.]|uniref:flavodoxin family protein n=1 Tax=uncultured Clostridium sp. TaxID=59620 RepID=UPI00082279E8|nr:flavodoxin family protein [uncultured Clostridium sp.]SCK03206.1 Putative NAD(P)H-dependent FMN-containing oxidoreductase ywqN [uncultured Clostridium sp.]
MNKKVLILSSSPRKGGNSDLLCEEFMKGAQENGNDVEKIFIANQKINYCMGCGVCNSTHQCVQNDDMVEILDKMVSADVIVIATPVYFYSMNGQLKTLIDRTVPRYTEISDKDFYYIMTAADTDSNMLERTIEGLRGFTEDCLSGTKEKGIIYGTGAWEKGEIKKALAFSQAYELGRGIK